MKHITNIKVIDNANNRRLLAQQLEKDEIEEMFNK